LGHASGFVELLYAVFVRQYPEVFKAPPKKPTTAKQVELVANLLASPLAFFIRTESPERDPTWLQSLPNEALRLFMKHVLGVTQGLYQPEIKGALQGIAAEKYSVEKFHKSTRVAQRFTTAFKIAYDSLLGAETAASAGAAEGGEEEGGGDSGGAGVPPTEAGGDDTKTPAKESSTEKKKQRRARRRIWRRFARSASNIATASSRRGW